MAKKKQKFNKKWFLFGLIPLFILVAVPIDVYKSDGCRTGQFKRASLVFGGSLDRFRESDKKSRISEEKIEQESRDRGQEIAIGCSASYTYVQFIL